MRSNELAIVIGEHRRWLATGGRHGAQAKLTYECLSRRDLSAVDLSHANLSFVAFDDTDLSDANLYRACLYGASFSGANVRGTHLALANLRDVDLRKTKGVLHCRKEEIQHHSDLYIQDGGTRGINVVCGGLCVPAKAAISAWHVYASDQNEHWGRVMFPALQKLLRDAEEHSLRNSFEWQGAAAAIDNLRSSFVYTPSVSRHLKARRSVIKHQCG